MTSPIKSWRETKKLHLYLGKKGRLLVWTQIFNAPSGFEYQTPYFVGIVEFDPSTGSGRVRMPVQIVDCSKSDLKPNLAVQAVIRRTKKPQAADVIEYGVKVKPFDVAQGKP